MWMRWKWNNNWRWKWNWKYCSMSFANRSDMASAPTIRVMVELNLSKSIHTTVGLGCEKINREVLMNSNSWTKEPLEGNLSALFLVFYLRRSRWAVVVNSWHHKILSWEQFENINKAKQGQERFGSLPNRMFLDNVQMGEGGHSKKINSR